jgi:hypothetical protein
MKLVYLILLLCPCASLGSFYAMGPPAAPWTYDLEMRIKSYDYPASTDKDGAPQDSNFSSGEGDPTLFENHTAHSRIATESSYFWLSDTNKFKHAVRLDSITLLGY